MLASVLLLAAALPPVLADPRHGPSAWAVVTPGDAAPIAAAGYLVATPAGGPDQAWLEGVVALAAGGAPVVATGSELPPAAIRPYLDGVVLDPAPAPEGIGGALDQLAGLPLILPAADAAEAVRVLALGAAAALVPDPDPRWVSALAGLLPEYEPALGPAGALATALRGADLATVVGLPRGFAGGPVRLAGGWYGAVTLVGSPDRTLSTTVRDGAVIVTVPALPGGGLLVASRPLDPSTPLEQVQVTGERIPEAGEVLARHQRQAARQQRLVSRWQAEQTLLLRVWVAELSRSFEVVLAGPAFWEAGTGTDWEIARAWVDGVSWRPDRLPNLPLLEPERPSVPPLALRLEPSYHYRLRGRREREGRGCWELEYDTRKGEEVRRGVACIDALTWGLVALEESATGLGGEVRATRTATRLQPIALGDDTVWLPSKVEADDTVAVFGGTATVRRELTLVGLTPSPGAFTTDRAAAWGRPNRMLRDTPSAVLPLQPDGHGGRVVGSETRPAQRFLILGAVWDPGLATPVPFGGLQILDYAFRDRPEQLQLLLAGVVNDGAWTHRFGPTELTARAFTQVLPFSSTLWEDGQEQPGEELLTRHQRLSVGFGGTVSKLRLLAEAGAAYLDFREADDTDPGFVLPSNTWEGIGRVVAELGLGAATLSLQGEGGWRQDWEPWGPDGAEELEDSWTRARFQVVYEKALNPLMRLHLDAAYHAGWHVDRFSAPSPGRFGEVRLRGIASGTVLPERLAIVRAALAVPVSDRLRGEIGVDAAWAREERSGYEMRPLSGIGVAATVPGPWGTLMQMSVGVPLATPGEHAPTVELFLLRPF
ncbi:MAG: hypothetical protein MUF10_02275 [Thermoanaerobaculaceae bacterium]|nr:hypothetical protein [Thermoanaerobaculaceae bacterium]